MKKIVTIAVLIAISTAAIGCRPKTGNAAQVKKADTVEAARSESSDSLQRTDRAAQPAEQKKVVDITSKVTWGYREANRGRSDIDIIVVHSNYHVVDQQKQIFDFDVDGCIDQFRQGGTSAHYMITRDGTILKMVDEKNIAYHAGKSALPDGSRKWLNSTSIGIELISMKRDGPTEAQYSSLDWLIKDICSRYNIGYLVRHSDIATPLGRKDDPWGMDWKRATDSVKAKYPNITTYNIPVKNNPQFK